MQTHHVLKQHIPLLNRTQHQEYCSAPRTEQLKSLCMLGTNKMPLHTLKCTYMKVYLLQQSQILARGIPPSVYSGTPKPIYAKARVPHTLAKLAICYCILLFGY